MIKIHGKAKFVLFISAVLVVLFLLAEIINSTYEFVPRNKARAQLIIQAIYAYEQQKGHFPAALDDLRPDFLEEIPSTIGGTSFFYFTDSVDGFGIGFPVDSHYGCGYIDQYKAWECSFGD
jgi:hypothetical protein